MICKCCKRNMDELAISERERICRASGVPVEALSYDTSRKAVCARQAIWWKLVIENDFPLTEAAIWTGGHDHTSVLAGLRSYGHRMYGFSLRAKSKSLKLRWSKLPVATLVETANKHSTKEKAA